VDSREEVITSSSSSGLQAEKEEVMGKKRERREKDEEGTEKERRPVARDYVAALPHPARHLPATQQLEEGGGEGQVHQPGVLWGGGGRG
jgi:hypothetical protein